MRARAERMVGVLIVGLLLVTGCAASPFTKNETPGRHFDRAMKEFAAHCAKAKLKPNDTACDILKLRPADPLATEEGRFAHSIKIPNPVPADSGYRPDMTPQEYFDHLCKTEAGEFIYRTVENVEGIYMMRPRKEATDDELSHLYALEDPYGQVLGVVRHPQNTFVQPATGKYHFLEMPTVEFLSVKGSPAIYKRYYRDDRAYPGREYQTAVNGQFVMVPYVVAEIEVPSRKSRYGYTWRGISRPHDRELGIAGGELVILDLQTNEVIAVRRGYIRSGSMKNLTGIWWLTGQVCPELGGKREHLFVKEILRPATQTMQDREK